VPSTSSSPRHWIASHRDQEDVPALFKRLRFASVTIIVQMEDEITDLPGSKHDERPLPKNALYLRTSREDASSFARPLGRSPCYG